MYIKKSIKLMKKIYIPVVLFFAVLSIIQNVIMAFLVNKLNLSPMLGIIASKIIDLSIIGCFYRALISNFEKNTIYLKDCSYNFSKLILGKTIQTFNLLVRFLLFIVPGFIYFKRTVFIDLILVEDQLGIKESFSLSKDQSNGLTLFSLMIFGLFTLEGIMSANIFVFTLYALTLKFFIPSVIFTKFYDKVQ